MIFDKNIVADGSIDLIPLSNGSGAVESIMITNKSTNKVKIDVYIYGSTTFYIIKNTLIPSGTSLLLTDHVSFNNSLFALKITVSASASTPDVDVTIR